MDVQNVQNEWEKLQNGSPRENSHSICTFCTYEKERGRKMKYIKIGTAKVPGARGSPLMTRSRRGSLRDESETKVKQRSSKRCPRGVSCFEHLSPAVNYLVNAKVIYREMIKRLTQNSRDDIHEGGEMTRCLQENDEMILAAMIY